MARCAIYTRKSTAEGLDGEFTSLDNQRDYCAAFLASQAGEGWSELPGRYDDGGFSGGTLKRPGLARLRADIVAGLVDVVVVYKIDRLSRSLRDFANLVAEFERAGVTFVSVTQSFHTGTAMGRLTLNVLLSFAQFERELTGERLRDWFAGARARGLWMSGPAPIGYRRAASGVLVVEEAEAALVRKAYARYPKLGSIRALARELNGAGHTNNRGRALAESVLKRMLRNRVYRGELPHDGGYLPAGHQPIVSERRWRAVQRAIEESRRRCRARRREPVAAMLKGMIFGPGGYAMTHYFAYGRNGQLYRYYTCRPTRQTGESCPLGRLRAAEVEAAVAGIVLRLAGVSLRYRCEQTPAAIAGLVRRLVERVDAGLDEMVVRLATGAVVAVETPGRMADTSRRTKTIDLWRARRLTGRGVP